MVVVDRGDHRGEGEDHQRHADRERELEREGELELPGLVGLVLLHERLVDADPFERDQRDHRGRDDAVEADLPRAQQPRHDQPLDEHQRVDEDQEARRDHRPAQRPPAQLGAREGQPVAHRALPSRTSTR